MVGANTSSDCDSEFLGLFETFAGEVSRVEARTGCSEDFPISSQWGERTAYGVVMITSASTSSLSKVEFSPSLSDVVTRVCP
jgi:hypothetical protein